MSVTVRKLKIVCKEKQFLTCSSIEQHILMHIGKYFCVSGFLALFWMILFLKYYKTKLLQWNIFFAISDTQNNYLFAQKILELFWKGFFPYLNKKKNANIFFHYTCTSVCFVFVFDFKIFCSNIKVVQMKANFWAMVDVFNTSFFILFFHFHHHHWTRWPIITLLNSTWYTSNNKWQFE